MRSTIEIVEIADAKTDWVYGIEILLNGQAYFIADNQISWPGIRLGNFPSQSVDQEPWKKTNVYSVVIGDPE